MINEEQYILLCNEFFPIFKKLPNSERYAITLGGSHGKGLSDKSSDFDFRIYADNFIQGTQWNLVYAEINELIGKWEEKGVHVDGIWPRTIAEVDSTLELWISGKGCPVPYEWTVWGYNFLTDIFNQAIIDDPFEIAAGWKKRLSAYPEELKNSILNKHVASLRYWRNDYHYQNKVRREDYVFLASLTARLVHDILQVIYALNYFYFPGDGLNLVFTSRFVLKPDNLETRIEQVLYPGNSSDKLRKQHGALLKLIDDVLELVRGHFCSIY